MKISDQNNHINYQNYGQEQSAPSSSPNSDYQTFLKMLTTQITHQDPLNPMEGSDFAVQLATFSGVEQQAQTNKILEAAFGINSPNQVATYSNLLGRKVMTTAPAHFSGEQLDVALPLEPGSGSSFLIVTDAQGREVAREPILAGTKEMRWPTVEEAKGSHIESGYYSFHVETIQEGHEPRATIAGHFAPVTGVEAALNGVQLVLKGGIKIIPEDILAIRS